MSSAKRHTRAGLGSPYLIRRAEGPTSHGSSRRLICLACCYLNGVIAPIRFRIELIRTFHRNSMRRERLRAILSGGSSSTRCPSSQSVGWVAGRQVCANQGRLFGGGLVRSKAVLKLMLIHKRRLSNLSEGRRRFIQLTTSPRATSDTQELFQFSSSAPLCSWVVSKKTFLVNECSRIVI